MIPKVRLEVSKQNVVFRATEIRDKMVKDVFQRSNTELSGLVILGSTPNSDLSASVGYLKNKFNYTFGFRYFQNMGQDVEW